ncbi:hypothetical protein [Falsibacillus pallidus]|uniref:hypothetical protein n=1 Tax=Falsibacillus pallidus TaxID=493781 RepID=UPI003D96C0BB
MLWDRIEALKGCTIHTFAKHKPFHILDVKDHKCVIRVESSGKVRNIQRIDFEKALKLRSISTLNPAILRQTGALEANPTYVLAILKHLYPDDIPVS